MIIIPPQSAKVGDIIIHDGVSYIAEKHVSQGKDLKGSDYTHIMFDNKGCFAMREIL